MTVSELMNFLKDFPGDMRIFTRGYEDGYVDPKFYRRRFALNFYKPEEWYYGPHVESQREGTKDCKVVEGIYIG